MEIADIVDVLRTAQRWMQRIEVAQKLREAGIGANLKERRDVMEAGINAGDLVLEEGGWLRLPGWQDFGRPSRIWLIGEQNPYGEMHEHDQRYALFPLPAQSAGARLCRVLEMEKAEYVRTFIRRNLLNAEKWGAPLARAAADKLLLEHPAQDSLVLLGGKVATAFGVCFRQQLLEPPESLLVGSKQLLRRVLVIPHPSGRSREWNTPGTAERVREGIQKLGSAAPN